uniref:Reverse transcriptase domain-containing protein n=1 Tax=Xenopus tropicalis TaxID=8364 RepID=A0A803K2L7_XENTR
MRGTLISAISGARRATAQELEERQLKLRETEEIYISSPGTDTLHNFKAAQTALEETRTKMTQKKLLYATQKTFDKGEKNGKLLAYLSRAQTPPNTIPRINSTTGVPTTDPSQKAHTFAQFYQQLYATKTTYTPDQLSKYIGDIPLPKLAPHSMVQLNSPITLEEVREAVASLQPQKTPGPDGLPSDWYKTSSEILTPWLQKTIINALDQNQLPPSFSNALIVVIPKEGKDPLNCGSYRPISLLNTDAKIFAKILSNRLKLVIEELIHPDQTGFMPNKATNINIRRLFTNIHADHRNKGSRIVVSLDAAKAFDSVEWSYLWEVLGGYGLGEQFIQWVKLLYQSPIAKVRVNGYTSPEFSLTRGTRQGCPLSPLLFALAIEPLAIKIRQSQNITGLKLGEVEERISLYADDVLLYLDSPGNSLQNVLQVVNQFGTFSGLKINWEKSSVFPIEEGIDPNKFPPTPLTWVNSFKYLGVMVHRRIEAFLPNNLDPILKSMKERMTIWANLPLTIWGRINLIKMVFLPKFLYIFHNSPTPIPKHFFTTLDAAQTAFLWANKTPRFARNKLRAPVTEGGLGLPHWYLYYLASQIYYIQWWLNPDPTNPNSPLQATIATSPESLASILYCKPTDLQITHPIILTPYKTWLAALKLSHTKLPLLSPGLPLWANSHLPHFKQIAPYRIWPNWGIQTLGDILPGGTLAPRDQFRHSQSQAILPWYSYFQLSHALRAQFGGSVPQLTTTNIELTLQNPSKKKLTTALYALLLSTVKSPFKTAHVMWKRDFPEIDDDDWDEATDRAYDYLVSTRDRLIQFKIIHRLHLTPLRLHHMNRRNPPQCPKCNAPEANYIHLLWKCQSIQSYWAQVTTYIGEKTSLPNLLTPKVCLLGVIDDLTPTAHMRTLYRSLLFYARKCILLHWMAQSPPTIDRWLNLIKTLLPLFQITYIARGCPQKYEKVWRSWIDATT